MDASQSAEGVVPADSEAPASTELTPRQIRKQKIKEKRALKKRALIADQEAKPIEALQESPAQQPLPAEIETESLHVPCSEIGNLRPRLLEDALFDSIHGRSFHDVELHVYSHRDTSGDVLGITPVYARAEFLRSASPVLRDLLANGSSANSSQLEDYDIRHDEDLRICDPSESMQPELPRTAGTGLSASTSTGMKVISVDFGAARTWQALIYYLYTQRVCFTTTSEQPGAIPEGRAERYCSPKSMYKLARKLSLDALKELAIDAILSGLSANNIVDELFSDFALKHLEILEREVDAFRQFASNETVQADLRRTFRSIASGTCAAGADAALVLIALFDALIFIPS